MSDTENPIRRLIELAAGIHIRTRRWSERRLKAHGMTFPQYGALEVLAARPGPTQRELAQALQTDTTTAMVLCDALERKGWLERRADPVDRRANRLHLTASGEKAFSSARPEIEAGFAAIATAITEDQAHQALGPLETLYGRITEISLERKK